MSSVKSGSTPDRPQKLTLSVYGEFKASHSLQGFEIPHFHLWKLRLEFVSSLPLGSDRLLDLVWLQQQLQAAVSPLNGRHLNAVLPELSPTSENLALWVWDEFLKLAPETPLHAVTVQLCDLEGLATGEARVTR